MAGGTFHAGVVLLGVNAYNVRTPARGVRQRIMTTQAKCPAPVDRQFRGVRRMIDRWAMAVFALDYPVRGFVDAVVFIGMTILAVFLTLIFHLDLLPVFLIGMTVPAIHVTALTDPEILWDDNHSGQQYQNDDTDHHNQRSQYMILHNLPLLP